MNVIYVIEDGAGLSFSKHGIGKYWNQNLKVLKVEMKSKEQFEII